MGESCSREEIKEKFGPHGDVAYVDYQRGEASGFVRMESADGASKAAAASAEMGWTVTLVGGEEETQYWQGVRDAQLARRQRAGKGKGGARAAARDVVRDVVVAVSVAGEAAADRSANAMTARTRASGEGFKSEEAASPAPAPAPAPAPESA